MRSSASLPPHGHPHLGQDIGFHVMHQREFRNMTGRGDGFEFEPPPGKVRLRAWRSPA